jgi:aspartyl-tRNA(Asn)/glutamyl-tRNA(Gln) amidotransferase subunit C
MIEIKDIEKLAALARIEINESEKAKLGRDLESIVSYVSELTNAPVSDIAAGEFVQNVTRPDEQPYPAGEFTEAILAEAPDRSGQYFKVKKIFN